MSGFDDLNLGWGEQAYVLLRPKAGLTWDAVSGRRWDNGGGTDWRPAMVVGFQDEGERDWYGTRNDPRRVYLIGKTSAFPLSDFEFGAVLDMSGPGATIPEADDARAPVL